MVRDATSSECGAASSGDSWANCVAGTLKPGRLLYVLEQVGFADLKLVSITGYRTSAATIGALFSGAQTVAEQKD